MRYDLVDRYYPQEPDPAFRRRAAWILAQVEDRLAHCPDGTLLVDIGCGQGFYFPMLVQLGARVTGVETDPVPLAKARHRALPFGAQVVSAAAEALPFPTGSFDIAVMSEVLEHLADPAFALAEAARVLRPGGLLLITVPHADYPLLWDPVNRIRETLGLSPVRRGLFAGIWANHVRLYRPDHLVQQIDAAGFRAGKPVCQTRFAFPFVHNLVYGFGRAALERGILPHSWLPEGLRGADQPDKTPVGKGRSGGPVSVLIGLIRLIDKANQDALDQPGPSVNLCISATRSYCDTLPEGIC